MNPGTPSIDQPSGPLAEWNTPMFNLAQQQFLHAAALIEGIERVTQAKLLRGIFP